jgi:hypothetical protein
MTIIILSVAAGSVVAVLLRKYPLASMIAGTVVTMIAMHLLDKII